MTEGKKVTISWFLASILALTGLSAPASTQKVSENMQHMEAIAHEIANCNELDGIEWVEVSAIFAFDDEGDANESYGYAYDRDGKAHAVTFLYNPIEREVNRYREWLRLEGDKGFIKMLFQFNRETRKVNADFEYDNPTRWQVTPKNIDVIPKELRPDLGR